LDTCVNKSTGVGSNGMNSGLNALGKYILAMLYDLPEEVADKQDIKDKKAGKIVNFGSHFMPIITNLALNFDPTENNLEILQVNDTFNGYKHAFVKHDVNSVSANTFNISYNDLEGYPITNLHFAWYEYMKRIRDGSTSMSRIALKKRIIDYPTSLYYFQLAPDGYTLNYWCKYTGVFPTNIPFSVYRGSNNINPAEVQICYQYVKKDDMDPVVLKEFNDAVNGIFPEMDQPGGLFSAIFNTITSPVRVPVKAIRESIKKKNEKEASIGDAQAEIDAAETAIYKKFYGKYSIAQINDPKNYELLRSEYPEGFNRLEQAISNKNAVEQNYIDKSKAEEVDGFVSEWYSSIKNFPREKLKDYAIGEGGQNYDPFFQSVKPQVYKIPDEAGNSKLALIFE
jgi:hypothetical protein